MAAVESKTAHKINNSYESEPSTGSGSSLSENNEYHISVEEHMNLPYLLKPKPLSIEHACTPPSQLYNSNKTTQESPFRGFGDSPYGNVNKQLYGSQLQNLKLPELQQNNTKTRMSPGMKVFPRFYDTVVEENSCNAVDMPLCKDQATVGSSCANTSATTIKSSLSFDGKFKNLSKPTDEETPTTSAKCAPQTKDRLSSAQRNLLNTSQQHSNSFMLKKFNNERSPDLFADSDEDAADDDDDETDKAIGTTLEDVPEALEESHCINDPNYTARYSLNGATESSFINEHTLDTSATQISGNDTRSHFLENCRRERELYRRIKRCLQGVRPPPSVTNPDMDVINMVVNMKANVLNFLSNVVGSTMEDSGICSTPSLFKPTHSLAEAQSMGWRDVLGIRQHGLSYNLNKAAEQNEYLRMSVVDRYVGAETATSYVRSPSSAKKRTLRMKMLTQSPGNRLSHLAKRRNIFSSANLATNSMKLNSSIGPQILLDKKKARNKRKATPKRKTPASKKKGRKTPSSSARKRICHNDLAKPGPSRESSKRALFQSPAKSMQLLPPKLLLKPEIANRVEKSKRALFSPDNQSHAPSGSDELDQLLKRKRNDDEDADELASQSSKLFRASSSGSGLTPRALKIKSQSFCIGAGSSTTAQKRDEACAQQAFATNQTRLSLGLSGSSINLTTATARTPAGNQLQRAQSEMSATPQNTMTDNQRKKLLWAVSQALQEKKISTKHENFRQHAADLARIVKRIFQEFYLGHTTSNSETLLRLAKKYAYSVISRKNADDVYLHARSQECESKRQSSTRLCGYIGAEEFEQRKLLLASQSHNNLSGSMQNIFGSTNSIDSFGLSQPTTGYCETQASQATQSSLIERISEDLFSAQTHDTPHSASKQQPIRANAALQNSSSKSNLGGLALRENVDCEQRRSAQKNFTGKDQRNISPYYGGGSNSNGSARKFQAPLAAGTDPDSGTKAKRQISFDS